MSEDIKKDIKYLGQAVLTGIISVKTGLHIGAGKDAVEIGGIDSPVVKTPEGDPYIPGSSLKGKLRFLMEWAFGKVADGKPWSGNDPNDPILRIFGVSAGEKNWKAGPSRLLVRDAMLDEDWRERTLDAGREFTEAKAEVTIDRISGTAGQAGPRHTERVPPGAKFKLNMTFRLYDTKDNGETDRKCLAWLIQGLDLLEHDALGGSGSRGYGQIEFSDLILKGPKGENIRLDGNEYTFREKMFDKDVPNEDILQAVNKALGVG